MRNLRKDNFMLTDSDLRIPKKPISIDKLPKGDNLPIMIEFNYGRGRALGEAYEDHGSNYAVELLHPATEQQTIMVPKSNVVKILTKKEAQDLVWFLEDHDTNPENYENMTIYGHTYRKHKTTKAKTRQRPIKKSIKKVVRKKTKSCGCK